MGTLAVMECGKLIENFEDSLVPQQPISLFVNRNMELALLTQACTTCKTHYQLFLDELDSRLDCVGLFIGGLKPVYSLY